MGTEGAEFETCSLFFGEEENETRNGLSRTTSCRYAEGIERLLPRRDDRIYNEERLVAQEHGLYDIYVSMPAATTSPARGGNFLSMAMPGLAWG